jgi:hypothetical protein
MVSQQKGKNMAYNIGNQTPWDALIAMILE